MKAIFVSDNNPAYIGFWEHQATHMWSRYGLRSLLYYIAMEPDLTLFTSEYAEVRHVPLLPTVPAIIQALFAKWYFPTYESSVDRMFICDIDCFILSREFVTRVQSETSIFHLAIQSDGSLPGYYVAGTPIELRTFFRADGISFEEFCLRAMRESTHVLPEHHVSEFSKQATPDWKYFGSEEHYAGKCARVYTGLTQSSMQPPSPQTNRICRSYHSMYNVDSLRNGDYIDYHCPRPFDAYATTILDILRQAP